MTGQQRETRQVTVHFRVHGRVQGVFYRATTREEASRLGITGWVRNLRDGTVDGMARGPADTLDRFRRWLHDGPDLANVHQVDWEEVEDREFHGFQVR